MSTVKLKIWINFSVEFPIFHILKIFLGSSPNHVIWLVLGSLAIKIIWLLYLNSVIKTFIINLRD